MRIRLVNTYKALIYKASQTLSSQYKLASYRSFFIQGYIPLKRKA